MIRTKKLNFHYGKRQILRDIDLVVQPGEFVCLLGESGCGKSTLLRIIAGLLRVEEGTLTIHQEPVSSPGKDRAVVFQDYSLFPWMTTGENLVLALKAIYPGLDHKVLRKNVESYLEMVGLQDVYDKYPAALSGGMRQRAAIARALAVNPPILLMDEPFGALDPVNRATLQDLLQRLWFEAGRKRTVVFVTHDIEEALLLGTRIIVLGSSPGRIIADEAVDFPFPRRREKLFDDQEYKQHYSRLLAIYHREILNRANGRIHCNGSGI